MEVAGSLHRRRWRQMEPSMEVSVEEVDGGTPICFRGSFHLLPPTCTMDHGNFHGRKFTSMEVGGSSHASRITSMEVGESFLEVDGNFHGRTPKKQIMRKLVGDSNQQECPNHNTKSYIIPQAAQYVWGCLYCCTLFFQLIVALLQYP